MAYPKLYRSYAPDMKTPTTQKSNKKKMEQEKTNKTLSTKKIKSKTKNKKIL